MQKPPWTPETLYYRGPQLPGHEPVLGWACEELGTQQEVSLNVMSLNLPQTTPSPRSVEKLSSTELVPGAKKVGDHGSKELSMRQDLHNTAAYILQLCQLNMIAGAYIRLPNV